MINMVRASAIIALRMTSRFTQVTGSQSAAPQVTLVTSPLAYAR